MSSSGSRTYKRNGFFRRQLSVDYFKRSNTKRVPCCKKKDKILYDEKKKLLNVELLD
jgi:hypothetical protein